MDIIDFSSATDTSHSLSVIAAPAVQSLQVDDGSTQRSMVTSLHVVFNEPVLCDAGAYQLVTPAGVQPVTLNVATSSGVDGGTAVDLTFSGPGISGGSLQDGQYTLIVQASKVHSTIGQNMAADISLTFFRLFGDYAGDGIVDNLDLAYFRMAYAGNVQYIPFFDYDGQNGITSVDVTQVMSRRYKQVSVLDATPPVVMYASPSPGWATPHQPVGHWPGAGRLQRGGVAAGPGRRGVDLPRGPRRAGQLQLHRPACRWAARPRERTQCT